MIKYSLKLSTLVINGILPDYKSIGTEISMEIWRHCNKIQTLYVRTNQRVYDSPRPEFLKMRNL